MIIVLPYVEILLRCDMGESMVKGAKGVKVKILFQGLHITCVIFVLVITLKFVFQIFPLTLHFRYKYKVNFLKIKNEI